MWGLAKGEWVCKGDNVRVLKLRPSPRMSIDPSGVGLVIRGNIIEMHCLGETLPEAGVFGTHGPGFRRDGAKGG